MKITASIFIILLFILHTVKGQWISQYPLTPGLNLYDIEFINKSTGWTLGDGGTILKTTNGGINLLRVPNPAEGKPMSSIHPVDSNIVYCVGYFETILKTTNGGINWITIRNGPSGKGRSYEGLFFINENTGWVCGQVWTYYNILKTTNGGQSWDSTYIFWGYLKDLYFKDSNTGLVSASGGGMYKTTNGGLDWNRKTIPRIGGAGLGDFRKLSVINNQYVFIVEDIGRVYKSSNFGDTWDSIGYVEQAQHPYSCSFSSLNTGWIGGTFGELFKSTDGGTNWRRENTGNDQRFFISFHFQNDSIGWGVGGAGKILYTSTSGLTFLNNLTGKIPGNTKLYQNYPNPFNPKTIIKFEISKYSDVQIKVYDIAGKEITILINKNLNSGEYETVFNGSPFTSGVYFYSLFINKQLKETKKLILLK